MYCSHVWIDYKKSVFSKIRVAYNNVFRRILKLPTISSASHMFASYIKSNQTDYSPFVAGLWTSGLLVINKHRNRMDLCT